MADKLYFEDYQLGDQVESERHHITREHLDLYMQATGCWHPLHTDDEYCRKQGLKGILVHGCMLAGIVDGFTARAFMPPAARTLHYGYDKVRWLDIVYPGDTVYSVYTLIAAEAKNAASGLLTFEVTTYNQHDKPVMVSVDKLYVERRPTAQGNE